MVDRAHRIWTTPRLVAEAMNKPSITSERSSSQAASSAERRAGLRNTQLLLAMALIILLVTILRYYPLREASAAPSAFTGPLAFNYYTLLRQGIAPSGSVPIYSPFDFGVNPGRGEVLFVRLEVGFAMLLGYDRFNGELFDASILESSVLT